MQLDFDLHREPEKASGPKIHSVTEITRRVRTLVEDGIGEVWVEGEISNLRRQTSGHRYFTLKDASSQLTCVLFASAAAGQPSFSDGQKVQVLGGVTVYEQRGQYQMIVRLVRDRGEGELQAKFESLKRKLAAEGLFEAARKRPMPRFPRRAGVVTAPGGAAIQDFLNVLHRRHPGIEVLINPVRVQGRGAGVEIARAIAEFGAVGRFGLPEVDVIVVTRGGGSMEDLWEFNEEAVARAIAASPIPVLTAIGHEIDFSIADFVADLRAPTPSAAAEILAADRTEVLARLRQDAVRIDRVCRGRLELFSARLATISQSSALREAGRRVEQLRQTLDRSADVLPKRAELVLERARNFLARSSARLISQFPARALQQSRWICDTHLRRMGEPVRRELAAVRARLERASGVLASMDPAATLARGFTITMDQEGRALVSAEMIFAGMTLRTRFRDGETESVALEGCGPSHPPDFKGGQGLPPSTRNG